MTNHSMGHKSPNGKYWRYFSSLVVITSFFWSFLCFSFSSNLNQLASAHNLLKYAVALPLPLPLPLGRVIEPILGQ